MSQEALLRIAKCLDAQDPCLDLSYSGLTTQDFLPDAQVRLELLKCKHISTLILSNSWYDYETRKGRPVEYGHNHNNFKLFLHNISGLDQLTKLICSSERTSISFLDNISGISHFKNLTYLDLSFNSIASFRELTTLKNLRLLRIRSTGIADLADITQLQNLEELHAANNRISYIDGLARLKNLKILDLRFNYIDSLRGLTGLPSLELLNASHNHIGKFSGLGQLNSLQVLNLEDNNLEKVDSIEGLQNLKTLNISFNRITELPNLEFIPHLKKLEAASNRIKSLKGIHQLQSLEILNACANILVNIEELSELQELQELYLGYNEIENIESISRLQKLQKLDLSFNHVREIESLSELYKIRKLDLKNNEITNIEPLLSILQRTTTPVKFVSAVSMSSDEDEINVVGNNLYRPDTKIVSQGREAVLAYFQNLKVSKLVPFREAKVILLGEPDAGKTNLLNFFLGRSFEEEKSVTRGVNIAKHSFEFEDNTYQINFWDFGGQEVQQSVHQYFLTENTLYLIVLNAVTDEQPDKYLQFLDNHAPSSPFIIVTNKDDLNGNSKLRNNQVSNDYKGRLISSEIRLSLRQAANVEWCHGNKKLYLERQHKLNELLKLVKNSFLKLPHLEQGFLLNYKIVKEIVEDIYEKEKKPYITMQQFQKYCEDAGIAAGTERSLLSHLNFIGTVRYIDKDNLRGLHILNPEWLSDGIYRIITDSDVKNVRNGKIEKLDIRRILKQAQESKYIYQENEIDFIITMMCHFRVAYYDDQNKFIYIPNSFPEDLPFGFDKKEFKTHARHYFFSYETEIPSYILNRFIVKTFKMVKGNVYWNKGILLEDKENKLNYCEALIEQNDRIIDIWIKGKDIQMFFAIIREALRNSHEESFTKFEEMIDLGGESISYRTILNLKYDGDKEFKSTKVIDPETRKLKMYNINEVLGRFESNDEIANHENSQIHINLQEGDLIVQGQFGITNSQNPKVSQGETDKLLDPVLLEHRKNKLKTWKNNAWIILVLTFLFTIFILMIYFQNNIAFLDQADWLNLKKNPWVNVGGTTLMLLWTSLVAKLFYDRIFDHSKQKAYMDTIKLP